jgi:hypothetical protein
VINEKSVKNSSRARFECFIVGCDNTPPSQQLIEFIAKFVTGCLHLDGWRFYLVW